MSAQPAPEGTGTGGSTHDLWIGDHVLTVRLDRSATGFFPPTEKHAQLLQNTIQGLARAAKAVMFHASNDNRCREFNSQPIEDLVDAIILLSQLSAAVQSELSPPAL